MGGKLQKESNGEKYQRSPQEDEGQGRKIRNKATPS
jgi:hypothetical protein